MTKLPRLVEGTYTGPMFMGVVPTQNPIVVEKRRDMNDQPTARVLAFLRAAHDEIERVARAAAVASPHPNHEAWWQSGGWEADDLHVHAADEGGGPGAQGTREEAAHIALHDPRAALARVQAERRLVEAYESGDLDHLVLADVLRTLAQGHRHTVPGYDPAWAPKGVSADA